MTDIFQQIGIEQPKDIFATENIQPPTAQEQNINALNQKPVSDMPEQVQTAVNENTDKYEKVAKTLFTDDEISQMKAKGKIGFREATDFLTYQDVLPGGGVYKAADALTIYNAGEKIKKGEPTTVYEDETLNKFVRKQVEMNLRGLSWGGGITYYGSQMPAFMTEFAATGGVGKLAQVGATRAAENLVEKGVVTKLTGIGANVAARTSVMPSMYLQKYGERRVNDFMSVTDKGDLLFKESQESPAISALKAFGHTSIEVGSEMSGAAIGKYVVEPVAGLAGRYLRTPINQAINNIPVSVRQGLYDAYLKIKPNASVTQVFSAAGWNGMLEELGEERVADVLHATLSLSTDKNYTFDDYLDEITPSKDQLMLEAGLIGIMGGVHSSANIAANILNEHLGDPQKSRETVSNMSATELDNFVNNHLKLVPSEGIAHPSGDPVTNSQLDTVEKNTPQQVNDKESTFNRFYRDVVNRLQPIEDMTKGAQAKGAEIQNANNPFLLSRTYSGIIGNIRHNLVYGTTSLNEQTGRVEATGKGLKSILDDFDNNAARIEKDRDTRTQDFEDYLIANRYLNDLKQRDDVQVTEEQTAKSISDMSRLAEKYGEEFNWFHTHAVELYEYQKRVLHQLVESGVMSQDKFDQIFEKNKNYVPFQRVLDEEENNYGVSSKGKFTDAFLGNVVKGIKGSEKEIKNTAQSIISNTARTIQLSYRNRVARAVADLADVMPEYVQRENTPMKKVIVKDPNGGPDIETYRPSGQVPEGTITVFRNGKKEFYRVSKPLLNAMNNLSPHVMNATVRMITAPFRLSAQVLRTGATIIPEFWVRNVIRDQQTAFLQSPIRSTPIDTVRGLVAVIGHNELYKDWMRNGGSFNSYMELDDKGLETASKELLRPGGRLSRYLGNPLNILSDISGALEKSTRVGVYAKAQRLGIDGLEAALMSREATLDFARGGTAAQAINQYVPFFNAGIQATDKLIRTFKENPKAATFWATATITVPSVLLTGYYLYGAPDDERREYLDIPQWQKDLFWVFKVDGQWRRIPKPFSFGYLFGSVPERFMNWAYQGDKPEVKHFWSELVQGIGGAFSPVYDASALMNPIVKVAIEATTNYNFFTGRSIYPEWMKNLEPEKRETLYTSETAREIGKLFGVSPAIVDNTLRGQLGGSSTYVTNAGDTILNAVKRWNGEDVPEKPVTQADMALVKAFTVREPVGYASNTVSNFFDNWETASQVYTTSKSLEGEEKQKFIEENQDTLDTYGLLKNAHDEISKLGKLSRRVYQDKTMSADDKVQQLSEYGKKMVDVAKGANTAILKK